MYHPGGGGTLNHTTLSWWLTGRARKIGVVETVENFLRFQQQKQIEVADFYLFHGFTVEKAVTLSEYSKLIPSSDLMAEPNAHLLSSGNAPGNPSKNWTVFESPGNTGGLWESNRRNGQWS